MFSDFNFFWYCITDHILYFWGVTKKILEKKDILKYNTKNDEIIIN
jgi:hypothetical protein